MEHKTAIHCGHPCKRPRCPDMGCNEVQDLNPRAVQLQALWQSLRVSALLQAVLATRCSLKGYLIQFSISDTKTKSYLVYLRQVDKVS